ncbi:MAG TPA: nucleoside triphosphate pyrophosphohydrolase family protein [Terriglobales bacterium]|nr:nucleoside triphosphate pyrophosphohydrolase family protein [Terriglobales bacterium]
MLLNDYQQFTIKTDQNPKTGYQGLMLPLLGLFGEVGSLLSELKKKQRDADSYLGYEDSVLEEFGDVLWYFANIAQRTSLPLNHLAQRMLREGRRQDAHSIGMVDTFRGLQEARQRDIPENRESFETGAIALAGKVGRLLDDVSLQKLDTNHDLLGDHLVAIFKAILRAANDANVSLDIAVQRNMKKVTSRWPIERTYPELFDADLDVDEQLPRRIEMLILEKKSGTKTSVVQKCNGINIGDRLTDNKAQPDDYRFHDVFHLANAAVLGWSPVIRALLRVKRRSNPGVDETEDGARAILIEEGVATWIFNHASRLNYFETINSLDYSLLKAVKELVTGYEVELCPLWLWEEAILQGYKVFRFLKQHRKGLVVADLTSRTILVQPA